MDELRVSSPAHFGIATYPPGAAFGPRFLPDYEFVWMLEGDARYHREDIVFDAPEGAFVLCRPGATDLFTWDPHRRTRHAYFHFAVEHLPRSWPPPDHWPTVRLPGPDDILHSLFRHLLTQGNLWDASHARLTVALGLTAFVSGHLDANAVAHAPWPEAIERAWSFMQGHLETHPEQEISLSKIAEAACVTPAHLCRTFKTVTGHTPAETVRLARLERAATLLSRSNYSVAEVAALCGFASPFHFSRRFKEAFRQTPSEVRQAVRDGVATPLPRLLYFSHKT